jgi:uncharacterized protein (DUF1800 family)
MAAPACADLVASVLPNVRTVPVVSGQRAYATAFATVINSGAQALTGCRVVLPGDTSVGLDFQTTRVTDNSLTGVLNEAFDLGPGQGQTLLLSFYASRTLSRVASPVVTCVGGATSPAVEGLSTISLRFVGDPAPDIIPIGIALPDQDGIIKVPNSHLTGVFVVAAVNNGEAADIRVRPVGRMRTEAGFPAGLLICETSPMGACLASPAPVIELAFARNQVRTFNVYVTGHDQTPVAFDPAANRVSVQFTYGWDRLLTGATGAAVTVPAAASTVAQRRDAARFLGQGTFGPTQAEVRALAGGDYAAWLEQQFNTPATESHAAYLRRGGPPGCNPCDARYINALHESFWLQAVTGQDQVRRRVAFALTQLFVVSEVGSSLEGNPAALGPYLDLLETHALGNFRDLLREVARSPAMGHYLSHFRNERAEPTTGRLPDENFAREVLQLFSIGLWELNLDGSRRLNAQGQPIPTYDQTDILNLARVFTGMSWNGPDTSDNRWHGWPINGVETVAWDQPMQFYARFHAPEPKVILKRETIPANTPGQETFDRAIDVIFNHPNVGPFVSRQLIQRLVTSNPSPAYIARVASRFNDNGQGARGDMRAVVRAILLDAEARGPTADPSRFGKLREPMLRFSYWLRANGARADNGRFMIWNLENPTDSLGQNLFRSPSVFNFYRPDYAPPGDIAAAGLVAPEFQITHETSVTGYTNAMQGWTNYGYGWNEGHLRPDYSAELGLAHTPHVLVDYLAEKYGVVLSTARRDALISAVGAIDFDDWWGAERRVQNAVFMMLSVPDFTVQK